MVLKSIFLFLVAGLFKSAAATSSGNSGETEPVF